MVIKIMRRASSLCLLLPFLVIAALGLSATVRSEDVQKTAKTEFGDIYDCVDFYKQPAFDHPLLKNHSYHPQMRPTFLPQRTTTSEASWNVNATETDITRLEDGGCPEGTVPIRRTKNKLNDPASPIYGNIFALGQTTTEPTKVYNGLGGIVSVYNPRVFPDQYSSAELIIRGGTDYIIFGWTVNPIKYPDTKTRFFIYTGAGDMHCFNSDCGFVLVRWDTPLDMAFRGISKRREQIYENQFFVHRDPESGDWWLQVGLKNPTVLGFWPKKIFVGLQQPATYVACGGEAYTPSTIPPPEMGAGWYPDMSPNTKIDAYFREFNVLDANHKLVDAGDTKKYQTQQYYGVADLHMHSGQHLVTFGGPY